MGIAPPWDDTEIKQPYQKCPYCDFQTEDMDLYDCPDCPQDGFGVRLEYIDPNEPDLSDD